VGQKKYNGLELDERTGACFVGHGFSRDTRLPDDAPLGGRLAWVAQPYAVPRSLVRASSQNVFRTTVLRSKSL
jgi:hypothetical protein